MIGKYILVGKGGSGKDFVASLFEDLGYRIARSVTTRQRRRGLSLLDQKAENRYDFVENHDFKRLIDTGRIFEYKTHQGCVYGTTVEEWRTAEVHVIDPIGIDKLHRRGELEGHTVIYLDRVPQGRDVRRPNGRRREKDARDFKGFNLHDFRITAEQISHADVLRYIEDIKSGLFGDASKPPEDFTPLQYTFTR